jgi:hypothetical protein
MIPWSNLRHQPIIYLEGLSKTTKILNQSREPTGGNFKMGPSQYEAAE